MHVEVAKYNAMLKNVVNKEEKEQIMALNIVRILKIKL